LDRKQKVLGCKGKITMLGTKRWRLMEKITRRFRQYCYQNDSVHAHRIKSKKKLKANSFRHIPRRMLASNTYRVTPYEQKKQFQPSIQRLADINAICYTQQSSGNVAKYSVQTAYSNSNRRPCHYFLPTENLHKLSQKSITS